MKMICVACMCVLLTVPAGAQQRLSDVAGSVRIEQGVVIDDSQVGRVSAADAAGASYSDSLQSMQDRLEQVVARIDALIGEVDSGSVLYSRDWRSRAVDAARDLEHEAMILGATDPPAGQEQAFESAVAASAELRAAGEVLRDTVATRSGALGAHNKHLREGRRLLSEAILMAGRVERTSALELPPPALSTMDALAAADALCAARAPEASAERAACERAQRDAVLALENRHPIRLGMEEAEFNRVRNSCLTQWPEDFARRDSCERHKVAEATGAVE